MSLGYPSVVPKPGGEPVSPPQEGVYGVPEYMLHGFSKSIRNDVTPAHPLEFSEAHWNKNQEGMDFAMLRNEQGIHAPLRLQFERNMAQQIQRLPCLHSSRVMLDTLTGKDYAIGFEDFLNDPADTEAVGQPHAMMEKNLHLL